MIDEIVQKLAAYRRADLPADGRPKAAVLIPLYNLDGELHVVLTRRTDKVATHKGEICFPGGAMEELDPDLTFTALRESYEEIGLEPADVEILGQVDDIVTISRFHVSAFIGAIDPARSPYLWQPQPSEVAEVLEVPLAHLTDRVNTIEVPRMRDGKIVVTEGYLFGEHTIWGATARMLRNFIEVAYLGKPLEASS